MKSKKEILILKLDAQRYWNNKKMEKIFLQRSVNRFAKRFVYPVLISLLGGIIYLSFILEISPIEIFNF